MEIKEAKIVFKDGHTEQILSCYRCNNPDVPQRVIYIGTQSGVYIYVETLEIESTPFADDNPFGKTHWITRWYKSAELPGRKQNKINHIPIDDIKGVLYKDQMCCEVSDGN